MHQDTQREPSVSSEALLVIGARGKTGRRVAARLEAAGRPVVAASRSSATRFDWQDRTTWIPVLEGVEAAYLTFSPDLALPGAADIVGDFADLAVAHGVRRLVLLSGRGEAGARLAEQRLQESGADWTIVRCAFFNQNFSEIFAESIRAGVLAMPAGETAEPFLDVEDIADVVVAALTEEGHVGQLYELTGPRLLRMDQVAEIFHSVLGQDVKYAPVSAEDYALELAAIGMPMEEAGAIAGLIEEVLDGRNAYLADGVQRALGRAPRDFADYVRETAMSGIWAQEGVEA